MHNEVSLHHSFGNKEDLRVVRMGDEKSYVADLPVKIELIKRFEDSLDPKHPERSGIPAKILGYGEIGTVLEIQKEEVKDFAFKRMPMFVSEFELRRYEAVYETYCDLLLQAGLKLPRYWGVGFVSSAGRPVFYIIQEKLDPLSIGHRAIHVLAKEEIAKLVRAVLGEFMKVWEFNQRNPDVQIAIDGQVSNWSIMGFDQQNPGLGDDIQLKYFDTSTPLYRIDGVEQLNTELFLRNSPPLLARLLGNLVLEDVVGHYYDLRGLVVDMIANFHKEGMSELVGELVEVANDFFSQEGKTLGVFPISQKEVDSFYRKDAAVWSVYLDLRKLDRFFRTKVLRKDYPYVLPPRVKRHWQFKKTV
ncbi:MAG: DUF6206 family protein [Actinomycetota bacterium]|nr:DUF6206 family protein [Actinomycetota bacterium]